MIRVRMCRQELAAKEEAIVALGTSLANATQRAADAQEHISDLTRAARDMEVKFCVLSTCCVVTWMILEFFHSTLGLQ